MCESLLFLLGNCVDGNVSPQKKGSKVLLKGMRYPELQVCINFLQFLFHFFPT